MSSPLELADLHLRSVEPRLIPYLDEFGPCRLPSIATDESVYEVLMSAMMSQQLSGKAAATIQGRLFALFPHHKVPPPDGLLSMSVDDFRVVGVSRQKAGYLQDLAAKHDTIPNSAELHHLSDEEIIQRLIPIKGIGRWSVEMLLMFHLGRLDVLPVDDMAVQEGFKILFGLEARPKKKEMETLAEPWQPYRSVGSWYMWRVYEARAKICP